jgi:hypothetical protein
MYAKTSSYFELIGFLIKFEAIVAYFLRFSLRLRIFCIFNESNQSSQSTYIFSSQVGRLWNFGNRRIAR